METAAPVLDDTDRALITELQRDGRASWNHIGRGVGIADTTASRRAQRLMGDGVVRVVGGLDPLRCNLGYPVLIRMRTSPGRIGNVLDELAVREDVRFLAVVTGTSDVVAELIVTSQQHLARVVLDELHVVEGVESTVTSTVMRHYKLSHHERPALPVGPDGRPEVAADPLDEIDHRIVGELARDGRMSVATLAANLGISESMARRRVDALIGDGRVVISTLLDADALGYHVEALVWLGVDFGCLETVADQLRQRPEVRYLAASAGEAELVAEVLLRDQADLYRFATTVLGRMEGIRRTELSLELEVVKRAWIRLTRLGD
ncbi:MAG: Lrp/AsnC family transcriptional regulator [Actinomycetota bacterium]|jgi:DNA-binding Lrp family transcriptional regulator|uniref:Lrp/AsnC family transcriptional regulator n=1 Tax=Euzebya pacifica TaxID=1608957 RepID=UPI0030F990E4